MYMSVINLIVIITVLVNLILGLIVYLVNRKSSINKTFAGIVFCVVVWILSIFMYRSSGNIQEAFFWVKISNGITGFIPALFLAFSLVFPQKRKDMSILSRVAFVVTPIVFLILGFLGLIADGVVLADDIYSPTPGIFYIIFILYFLMFFILAFKNLFISYRHAEGVEKLQIKFFFIGTFATALIAIVTNLILPMLKASSLTDIGPSSTILLVIFTTYAIFKHHLFDIKVVLTELLVGLVAVVLLIDFIITDSLVGRLIKIDILIAFCYLGVSLIKSVLREIKYREEIKRAYDVEKLAHEELARLDEVKDQFLMATQHHLRTPITSMIGYTDMLLEGFYGDVSPKTRETLLKLMKSAKNLNKVVNELLDLSQFQLGKSSLFLKPGVEIMPILKSIIGEVKLGAKEKKIYLRMEKPKGEIPTIKADASKLEVALTNLIDNAVKYTPKGGVKIKVERPDSKIRITIKDTGVGMTSEDIGKLFSKTFERGEEAKKMFGSGKGIGLYLSFNIIKSHNGKLWAESEGHGKGSSFIVELPVG